MIQPNGASRLKGVVYLASTACYEPVLHLLHQCCTLQQGAPCRIISVLHSTTRCSLQNHLSVTLYNKVLLAESSLYPAIWGLYILDQDYREREWGGSPRWISLDSCCQLELWKVVKSNFQEKADKGKKIILVVQLVFSTCSVVLCSLCVRATPARVVSLLITSLTICFFEQSVTMVMIMRRWVWHDGRLWASRWWRCWRLRWRWQRSGRPRRWWRRWQSAATTVSAVCSLITSPVVCFLEHRSSPFSSCDVTFICSQGNSAGDLRIAVTVIPTFLLISPSLSLSHTHQIPTTFILPPPILDSLPALCQSNQENKWRQPCTSSLYSFSQQRKKKEDGAGNLIRSEATLPPGNSKSTWSDRVKK